MSLYNLLVVAALGITQIGLDIEGSVQKTSLKEGQLASLSNPGHCGPGYYEAPNGNCYNIDVSRLHLEHKSHINR